MAYNKHSAVLFEELAREGQHIKSWLRLSSIVKSFLPF